MFEPDRDATAPFPACHLVPLPALVLPAGFRPWRDSPPLPQARIKAVLTKPGQYRLVRGVGTEILARHPGWTPHGWQRLPVDQVLPPHWHAFPEALPTAGNACGVLFFDLRGEYEDCLGFGRYRGGWPFGDFVDRGATSDTPPPTDAARWAPYAWRAEESLGMGRAGSGMDIRSSPATCGRDA